MSNKQRKTSSQQSTGPFEITLQVAVVALFFARYLLPTEGTEQGDTVWIVQLWLGTAVLYFWYLYREQLAVPKFDRYDAAVGLLVFGHVVSAVAVLVTEGQKRSALNMLWEWLGIGVSLFLVRRILVSDAARKQFIIVFVGLTTVLAGLGLWQHFVWYPQLASQYNASIAELNTLRETQPESQQAAIERHQRIQKIQADLATQGAPAEGPARRMWEDRLRGSVEPIGLFALTNSFAGMLVVGLFLGISMLVQTVSRAERSTKSTICLCIILAVLAYCFLLTKSRTAWLALVCGSGVWLALAAINGKKLTRRAVLSAVGVLVLGVCALAVAFATNGIDREVITEGPKSMQYRLQFWTGTWDVIQEHPWLGTGPGNFRQHYLKYKLPESSEEIADPHNMFLDVWANGGLLALIGLSSCLAIGLRLLKPASTAEIVLPDSEKNSVHSFSLFRGPVFWGSVCAFFVVFLFLFLFQGISDFRILLLLPLWVLVVLLLARIDFNCKLHSAIGGVCFLALGIHLLASGGIAMPAVVQTLLVLPMVFFRMDSENCEQGEPQRRICFAPLLCCGLLFAGFLGCLFSAIKPVLASEAFLRSGEVAFLQDRNRSKAERLLNLAVEADPLSADALTRLAEIKFQIWSAGQTQSFSEASKVQKQAIAANPHSFQGYQLLGSWYREKHRRTQKTEDAQHAVDYYRQAVSRYPHNARLQSEYALTLQKTGQIVEARKHAELALKLDQISLMHGHIDKYLPEKQVSLLKSLLHNANELPNQN